VAGEDPAYLAWVRQQPCSVCGRWGSEAHHTGRHGVGQRAHDHTAVPLCHACHMAWHAASGWCRGMDKGARRQWSAAMVDRVRDAYDA
jgi:hypothetical protein